MVPVYGKKLDDTGKSGGRIGKDAKEYREGEVKI